MKVRSILAVAGLAVATSLVGAGTASADPGGLPIYLTCDNGASYQTTYFGGPWSPGPDLTSTTVIVPTAYGELTQTVYDAYGNIIEIDVFPAMTKGNSGDHERATTTSCTLFDTGTFEDPDLGTLTFTIEGTTTGFVTPVR